MVVWTCGINQPLHHPDMLDNHCTSFPLFWLEWILAVPFPKIPYFVMLRMSQCLGYQVYCGTNIPSYLVSCCPIFLTVLYHHHIVPTTWHLIADISWKHKQADKNTPQSEKQTSRHHNTATSLTWLLYCLHKNWENCITPFSLDFINLRMVCLYVWILRFTCAS